MAVCLKGYVFAIIGFLFDARVDMFGFAVPQPYILFNDCWMVHTRSHTARCIIETNVILLHPMSAGGCDLIVWSGSQCLEWYLNICVRRTYIGFDATRQSGAICRDPSTVTQFETGATHGQHVDKFFVALGLGGLSKDQASKLLQDRQAEFKWACEELLSDVFDIQASSSPHR